MTDRLVRVQESAKDVIKKGESTRDSFKPAAPATLKIPAPVKVPSPPTPYTEKK